MNAYSQDNVGIIVGCSLGVILGLAIIVAIIIGFLIKVRLKGSCLLRFLTTFQYPYA
jgi:hypothetical protein